MSERVRRVDFYPADWLAGIASSGLDYEAIGVYWQTCALAYSEGRPSFDEGELVAKLAGLAKSNPRTIRAAIERLVKASKLARNGVEIEPNRVRMELERSVSRIRKAHENASKRWKDKGIADAGASSAAMLSVISHQSTVISNGDEAVKEPRKQPSNEISDRLTTRFMEASGWRDEGRVGMAIFNLLTEGASEAELLHIGRELGIQKKPEQLHALAFLRGCLKRHREPRLVLPPAPKAKPAARTDAAWLAYRAERQARWNLGGRPGDEGWPVEPPLPVEAAS